MTFAPFPPWEPDRAEYAPDATEEIRNVLPVKDGWGPFPNFDSISEALPGPCKGARWVRRTDGTTDIYAATANKLFRLNGTDLSWDDMSRTGSAYLGVASGYYWSFQPFNNKLIACNANDEPQIIDVDTGTEFADLGGSPDKARFATTVGYQLGLFGHLDDPLRFSLSGYGDPTFWTRFDNGSGRQVLEKGGWIQGVVGDQSGAFIFQQDRIMRLTLLPGSDISFRVDEWERGRGAIAPGAIVSTGGMVFYKAEDDFYLLGQGPGEPSRPLGINRVAKFIIDDQNTDFVTYAQGAADPINKRVFWRYWQQGSTTENTSDGLICYDWGLDRWFQVPNFPSQYIVSAATQGLTLEGLDSIATLDSLPFSLDSSVWQAGRPVLGAFSASSSNPLSKLGFFAGLPRAAVLETGFLPMAGENRRAFVQGFRPVCDATGLTGRAEVKDTYGQVLARAGPTWGQDATGMIPVGGASFTDRGGTTTGAGSGRLHKFRAEIPAGTDWNHITGIEVKWRPEGRR